MKIYVITGSNKGIGKGLANMLLKKYNNNPDIKIILTGRDKSKIDSAIEEFSNIDPKNKAKLDSFQLDISNESDIKAFKTYVKQKYGYVSVLFNNAGIKNKLVLKSKDEKIGDVIKTFKTNFFGHINMSESLLDLVVKSPKETNPHIMFTNGFVGFNTFNNKDLKESFRNISHDYEIFNLYNNLLMDLHLDKDNNWDYKYFKICFSYGLSKVFLNSYMKSLSNRLNKPGNSIDIMVNSFNPGWCKTDMAGDKAPMTVEEGCQNADYMDSFGVSENKYTGLIFEKNKKFEF